MSDLFGNKSHTEKAWAKDRTTSDADSDAWLAILAPVGLIYFGYLFVKDHPAWIEAKAWALDLVTPMRNASLGGPKTDPVEFAPFGSPQWLLLAAAVLGLGIFGTSGLTRSAKAVSKATKAHPLVMAPVCLGLIFGVLTATIVLGVATTSGVLGCWTATLLAVGHLARTVHRERKA